VNDFSQLPSLQALIDRARACLSAEDLPHLVMNDPGAARYVAAFERVLAAGVPALLEDHEGRRRLESFDIIENLRLSHSDASRSPRHRWFSILTAGIELLGWDGWEGPSPKSSLHNLLTDTFALHAADDPRAPLDLLPRLCQELQQACENRHESAIALLSELLVATLSDAEVEAKCRELNQLHDEFQRFCDAEGTPNPWYAERPEFMWGAMMSRRAELRSWLELVQTHFPASTQTGLETRERLLRDGNEWRRWPRRG
jgi:hypothetical protein